jgi:hypothetical protein
MARGHTHYEPWAFLIPYIFHELSKSFAQMGIEPPVYKVRDCGLDKPVQVTPSQLKLDLYDLLLG